MGNLMYMLTGASRMGIVEEYFYTGDTIDNAAIYFALKGYGPIIAIDIATNLLAQDTITVEQYDTLETVLAVDDLFIRKAVEFVNDINSICNDTKYNDIGEHVRAILVPKLASTLFIDAFDKLELAISNTASSYFNYGQFATDPYEWGDHNNVVSPANNRMQWKIYEVKPIAPANVLIYPRCA